MKSCAQKNHTDLKSWLVIQSIDEATTSKKKEDKKVTKSKEKKKVADTNARIGTSNGQEKRKVDDVDNTQESLSQAQSVNSQQAPKSICSMLKA